MPTPTVRRLQLGNELRHLRERAGKDHADAAPIIERSQSVVSRIEGGLTGIRTKDLRDLVQFYAEAIGTTGQGAPTDGGEPVNMDDFLELNKGAVSRGRWRGFRNVYSKWFRMAVDLETDASTIDLYQSEIIHGLFQTEDYMRTLFTEAEVRRGDQSTDMMIKARLERRDILTKTSAPEVTAVLSESGLRRMVGSPEIMRLQHAHLAQLAEQPNIHIHVAPFRCRAVAALAYPFVRFRVPAANASTPPLEFVFVEQLTNGDYLDNPNEVAEYSMLWSGLLGAALDPVESRELLLSMAAEFE